MKLEAFNHPRTDQGTGAALAQQLIEVRRVVELVQAVNPSEHSCGDILVLLDDYDREARGGMTRPGEAKR